MYFGSFASGWWIYSFRQNRNRFFNAHSHGIPENSRDSRRLVTFPTRDEREFCSETGIPKLVPIRFRMIRFLQMCSGIGRTIRTQQLMIPRIAGDSGNSLTQQRLKGNVFSHNHAAFFAPIPRGGGGGYGDSVEQINTAIFRLCHIMP